MIKIQLSDKTLRTSECYYCCRKMLQKLQLLLQALRWNQDTCMLLLDVQDVPKKLIDHHRMV